EGGAQSRGLSRPFQSGRRARPLFSNSVFSLQGVVDMAPRVLVSDKLSPTAVEIFKNHGIAVDYEPDLGKDKEKLLSVIGKYDGLAVRSATKVTEKLIKAADNLKVIG